MGGGDVIGTAIVNLKSDTSGFISDLTSAMSKGQGLFSNFGSNITSSLKGVGGIMTAGITVPIVAAGLFAVKSFEDINNAETSLIRQTNSTGAAATQMKTSFTNVFGSVPQDAATVSSAMAVVSDRLHITGPALEDVTKQGLDMSRMLGVDATGAITGVTKALEAFQMPASDAGNVMDQLYVISTKTGVPINDLTSTLSKAGAVATSAKIDMESYTAVIGSLGASGLPARQANSLLTDSVTKLQTQLGKQDVGNEWNAMMGRIATNTATTADKTLLGQKNYDKLSASLKSTTTGYGPLLAAEEGSSGAIEKQSDATMTLSEKMDEFKNKAEVAFAPLGKVLITVLENALDAAKPVLDIITKLMGVFSNMPAPIQLIVVAIAGIAAALGPVMMLIGLMAPAIGPIVAILGMMGVEIDLSAIAAGGLTGALGGAAAAAWAVSIPIMGMELPLIAIIAAVAAIGIGLYLLYTYFKPFHDAVDEVVGWVKELVGDLMSGNFGKFGDDFKKGIQAGIDAITKIDWGSIANLFLTALLGIPPKLFTALMGINWGSIANLLWGAIKTALAGFATFIWDLWVVLPVKLWEGIIAALANFATWIWGLWQTLPGQLWNGIITALAGFGAWMLTNAATFFSGLPGGIIGAIGGLGDWMLTAAAGFFSGLTTAVQNAVTSLTNARTPTANENAVSPVSPGQSLINTITSHQEGGPITTDQIAMLHAGEYVVPKSGTLVSGASAASGAASAQQTPIVFNVAFNNATLTSQQQANQLAQQMAYKTTEYLRRGGHARG